MTDMKQTFKWLLIFIGVAALVVVRKFRTSGLKQQNQRPDKQGPCPKATK